MPLYQPGGSPTGTASGDLTGTYPGPSIASSAVTDAKVSSSAALSYSKLATLATGQVVAGNANVPTATTLSGDVSVGATGTTTIAAGAVTGAKLAVDAINDYHTLDEASGSVFSGATAGTYVVGNGGNLLWSAANIAANSVVPLFYIDPANYALSGYTTYANLDAIVLTNATAPGTITLTVGLYPISAVAGGSSALSATAGTVTAGSTCAFVNPSSSTRNHVNSGDFAFPSAGYYGFGVVTTATVATNAVHAVSARLSYRFST